MTNSRDHFQAREWQIGIEEGICYAAAMDENLPRGLWRADQSNGDA
jgi:hypothetical protein